MTMPFSLIFIFVLVPLFMLLSVIGMALRKRKQEEKLFRSGIIYLQHTRQLLMLVQQHRGLTNSYLHGNRVIDNEIEQLESRIAEEITAIQLIGPWIAQNGKWESILDHWSRLNVGYKMLQEDNNLVQHNSLIASLLYLIDDIAYAHELGRLGVVDIQATDWRYLLSIAEYIGQARALGMGVVSKGECSSVVRIQLHHLSAKIESHIGLTWPEKTKREFRHFLRLIEEQVVVDRPTITPADFFTMATHCIEQVLIEFDQHIEKMQFYRK